MFRKHLSFLPTLLSDTAVVCSSPATRRENLLRKLSIFHGPAETDRSSAIFGTVPRAMLSISSADRGNDNFSANPSVNCEKATRIDQPDQSISTSEKSLGRESSHENYTRAIEDLNSLQSNTQVLALAKYKRPKEILPLFEKQLKLAGIHPNDLDKLNIIHISGTKGKGSTCAYIDSILRAAGLKVGFYNSPHLVKVTERIRIDGEPLEEAKFTRYFRKIFDRLQREAERENVSMPSYFSFLTILAFHVFIEENVEAAIVEVGIGGEYDPTNIIQHPVACGISTLDYDHTNILGNTIESIAWSKAGIAKRAVPLFTIDQEQFGALDTIRSRSIEKDCPLFVCKPLNRNEGFKLGIEGSAQFTNAALACQLAKQFLLTIQPDEFKSKFPTVQQANPIETDLLEFPSFFRTALESCVWQGRCQIVRYSRIVFFLDGAHTRKSMVNCLDWFSFASNRQDPSAVQVLLVNVIGERDKREILRPLACHGNFDLIIFSTNRVTSANDIPKSETFAKVQSSTNDKSFVNVRSNANIWNELRREKAIADTDTVIMPNTSDSVRHIHDMALNSANKYHVLVTGSLHFVGAVLETFPVVEELLR